MNKGNSKIDSFYFSLKINSKLPKESTYPETACIYWVAMIVCCTRPTRRFSLTFTLKCVR